MKKLFLGLTAFILIVIGGIYGILFTSAGNSFVASMIENKVNEGQKDVSMKVDNFKLTMNDILFKATIDDNSTINVEGALNIFAQKVDLKYDVNVADLAKLENLTKQKLNGSFSTNGIVKGDSKQAVVKGLSKVASSNTSYDIELKDFNPSNILFTMKDAKIEELLYMVNQPIYAKGMLNIDANIKNADIENLDGIVTTTVSKGILNAKAINKELKEEPKLPIIFTSKSVSTLVGNEINSNIIFDSTIAKLDVKKANVNMKTSVIKSDYKVFVKDLAKLETLINQKLNGSFSTNGDVVVDNGVITVNGNSDIFASDTKYEAKVSDSKPEYVNLTVNKAKIENLLNLVNQPNFANGLLNIDAKIKSADLNNLDGKVLTTILEGKVNNKVVNKSFDQNLKDAITFKGDVVTDLVKTQAISKINLDTSLTNVDMTKAVYDIAKAEFTSDYTVDVPDLSKLKDITQQKMRGKAKIEGNIKQASELLSVDGRSKLFGGDIDFNLLNDNFKAKIDGVEIKDLTHMLYYPEIFTSKSNIDVDYNLATKIGKIGGNLLNGQFIKNEYSDLINAFAQFDLTKEIYEKVEIKSDMKKDIINAVVDMTSEHTTIKVPASTINTAKDSINALVQAKILKYEFDSKISGNLSNPKVSIDKKAFLNNTKAGQKIKKKTDELKNKIQEKLGDKLKLDQLFNKAPKQEKKKASREEIAAAFKEIFGN